MGLHLTGSSLTALNNAFAREVRPTKYGAKCDGGCVQNAAMTAGSNVVTAAQPAVLPVAGQLVTVIGAGAKVANSTVSGATSTGDVATVTTTAAHGLTTGQRVTISGVTGAQGINGFYQATVTDTTHFTVPIKTWSAYTSGGTVTPEADPVAGVCGTPTVSAGTMTLPVVDGSGNPVNAATSVTGAAYYYGSDDTAAWISAAAEANQIAAGGQSPVISWEGTSMVTQTITIDGPVRLRGSAMEYVNADGTLSGSSLPKRGSILRAHGTFTNRLTSAVLQLGSVAGDVTSGKSGPEVNHCTVDAIGRVQSAIRTTGARPFAFRTHATNGLARAWELNGSNSQLLWCIGSMPNTGDACYVTSGAGDTKIHGGYYRQGTNQIHIVDAWDVHVGGGVHIFSGWGGGNETPGTDVLIEAPSTGLQNISLGDIVFDGIIGPHVRITAASGKVVSNISVDGGKFFQPTPTGLTDSLFPIVQLDTSAGGTISGVVVTGYTAAGASAKYKSILDLIGGGTLSRIVLGVGQATNCTAHYSTSGGATRPAVIAPSTVYNGTANRTSTGQGQATATTTAAQTTLTIPHGLTNTPTSLNVQAANSTTPAPTYVTADISNITVTFPSQSAGVSLAYWWNATI